jgi:hypothetical protein
MSCSRELNGNARSLRNDHTIARRRSSRPTFGNYLRRGKRMLNPKAHEMLIQPAGEMLRLKVGTTVSPGRARLLPEFMVIGVIAGARAPVRSAALLVF